MGAPGPSHLGTWETLNLNHPLSTSQEPRAPNPSRVVCAKGGKPRLHPSLRHPFPGAVGSRRAFRRSLPIQRPALRVLRLARPLRERPAEEPALRRSPRSAAFGRSAIRTPGLAVQAPALSAHSQGNRAASIPQSPLQCHPENPRAWGPIDDGSRRGVSGAKDLLLGTHHQLKDGCPGSLAFGDLGNLESQSAPVYFAQFLGAPSFARRLREGWETSAPSQPPSPFWAVGSLRALRARVFRRRRLFDFLVRGPLLLGRSQLRGQQ